MKLASATVLAFAALVQVGCAGTQLEYNTLDVASTLADIQTRQVLENLGRTIESPYALPAQVDIQNGTITTSNSVSPALSTPLSRSATRTGADAISSLTTSGAGLTVGASDGWQQAWQVTPISDPATLTSIREFYHYLIYGPDGRGNIPPAALKLAPRRIFWSGVAADGSTNPPPPGVPVRDLGRFSGHELYIATRDFNQGYLTDVVLLVLPPAAPEAAAPGAGKEKTKKAAIKRKEGTLHGIGSVRPYASKPSILVVPPLVQ